MQQHISAAQSLKVLRLLYAKMTPIWSNYPSAKSETYNSTSLVQQSSSMIQIELEESNVDYG